MVQKDLIKFFYMSQLRTIFCLFISHISELEYDTKAKKSVYFFASVWNVSWKFTIFFKFKHFVKENSTSEMNNSHLTLLMFTIAFALFEQLQYVHWFKSFTLSVFFLLFEFLPSNCVYNNGHNLISVPGIEKKKKT